jgi:hypothetical protein
VAPPWRALAKAARCIEAPAPHVTASARAASTQPLPAKCAHGTIASTINGTDIAMAAAARRVARAPSGTTVGVSVSVRSGSAVSTGSASGATRLAPKPVASTAATRAAGSTRESVTTWARCVARLTAAVLTPGTRERLRSTR